MKDQIFGVLQRVGRSFMLPIAVLPVAGLLLGIGSSFDKHKWCTLFWIFNVDYRRDLSDFGYTGMYK